MAGKDGLQEGDAGLAEVVSAGLADPVTAPRVAAFLRLTEEVESKQGGHTDPRPRSWLLGYD